MKSTHEHVSDKALLHTVYFIPLYTLPLYTLYPCILSPLYTLYPCILYSCILYMHSSQW